MSYPVNKNGIALSVAQLGIEIASFTRGKTSNHHLEFPRTNFNRTDRMYRSVFRNLLPMVETVAIQDHLYIHDRWSHPKMPRDIVMIDYVEQYLAEHGAIECVYEKRTNQTHIVEQHVWEIYKQQYTGVIK